MWTILFNCNDIKLVNPIIKIGYSSIIYIPITFYHFIVNFLELFDKKERIKLFIFYTIGITFMVFLWASRLLIDGYYQFAWGYYPKAGIPGHLIFLSFLTFLSIRGIWLIYRRMDPKISSQMKITQYKYLMLAVLAYMFASFDFLTNYGFPIYPLGVLAILSSLGIIAYATLRYRIMELGLVIRWGLAFGILVMIISSTFMLLIAIIGKVFSSIYSESQGLVILISGCIVAFAIDPARKKIKIFVDRFIFKSPDFQAVLAGIDGELKRADSTTEIANGLISNIKNIWNVNHAGIALWNARDSKYELFPSETFLTMEINKFRDNLRQTDFLIKTLESERRLFRYGIVVDEELKALLSRSSPGEKTTFLKIRRTMRWIGAAVCVPLMSERSLMGFIILGPKNNKSMYNDEDKKFLSHVSEMVISEAKHILMDIPEEQLAPSDHSA